MTNMLITNVNQIDLIRQVRILKQVFYDRPHGCITAEEAEEAEALLDILDDMKYGDFNA